eukprot:Clim_evm36s211 gene=Clim_evmTU36s211
MAVMTDVNLSPTHFPKSGTNSPKSCTRKVSTSRKLSTTEYRRLRRGGKPPRPPTAWNLFCQDIRKMTGQEKLQDVLSMASRVYKKLSQAQKDEYKRRAQEAGEMHKAMNPDYKYNPHEFWKKNRGKKIVDVAYGSSKNSFTKMNRAKTAKALASSSASPEPTVPDFKSLESTSSASQTPAATNFLTPSFLQQCPGAAVDNQAIAVVDGPPCALSVVSSSPVNHEESCSDHSLPPLSIFEIDHLRQQKQQHMPRDLSVYSLTSSVFSYPNSPAEPEELSPMRTSFASTASGTSHVAGTAPVIPGLPSVITAASGTHDPFTDDIFVRLGLSNLQLTPRPISPLMDRNETTVSAATGAIPAMVNNGTCGAPSLHFDCHSHPDDFFNMTTVYSGRYAKE